MLVCPRCGQEAPDGARFCASCGAALARDDGREVRKTVTILFADVSGSTALGERLDPESFRRVMVRYFDAARLAIEHHGGTVEKFIGDAVMAVFGVPTLHEDDALRAVRAALELREALAALNVDLDRQFGVTLRVRIGIASGEVVTGTAERLATGDAVNLAARLEQAAAPDEILIDGATHALSRGAVEVEAVAPLELKGKSRPVPASRLLGVVEGASSFNRRFDAPLVGRGDDLAEVLAAFDEAIASRQCRLVTVVGPPGIGKSRLARELERLVTDRATVLTGACRPYGEGITYLPLAEIFRTLGAEDELDAALDVAGAEETFLRVRRAFEGHARERPLALIVDDIHWADPTLLDLLEHVVAWTRDAPILLVCLTRPELLDARRGWGSEAPARRLTLRPLSRLEADAMIAHLAALPAIPTEIRERIRDTADGNPLFVEQLLAGLQDQVESLALPPTIQALLAARIDGLPEAERGVVERASIVGQEFSWEALGVLDANGERPPGTRLATLVRKELIAPDASSEDLFRFRHALIRDAAYARVPKDRRARLHERLAEWLADRGEDADDLVGFHLEQAYLALASLGPVDDAGRDLGRRAAVALGRSAWRADARGDIRANIALLQRALAIVADREPQRVHLLAALGRAQRDLGEMDRAEVTLSDAVTLAEAVDLPAMATLAGLSLFEMRFMRPARSGLSRREALALIDQATQVFEDLTDDAGLGRAFGLAGKLHAWNGKCALAVAACRRSIAHAGRAGDRPQLAESVRYLLTAMEQGPTPVDEALAVAEELVGVAATDLRLRVGYLGRRASLQAMRGRDDEARAAITEGLALVAEVGRPLGLSARIDVDAGLVALWAGDPVAAEGHLRPVAEALETAGELGYLSSATPTLAEAVLLQGRVDEAMAISDRWHPDRLTLREDIDAQAGWRRVRAAILAARGELAAAEAMAREASAVAAPTDLVQLQLRIDRTLVAILERRGRTEEAEALRSDALRRAADKGWLTFDATLPPIPG